MCVSSDWKKNRKFKFIRKAAMEFLEKNPLYVVAIIATVIWLGIFFFILRLDKRVSKLEKE
jgi:CcmD family protein